MSTRSFTKTLTKQQFHICLTCGSSFPQREKVCSLASGALATDGLQVHRGAWHRDEERSTARLACEEGEGASGALMGKISRGMWWEGGGARLLGETAAPRGPLLLHAQNLRTPVPDDGMGSRCPHLGCAVVPFGALCIQGWAPCAMDQCPLCCPPPRWQAQAGAAWRVDR